MRVLGVPILWRGVKEPFSSKLFGTLLLLQTQLKSHVNEGDGGSPKRGTVCVIRFWGKDYGKDNWVSGEEEQVV